MIDKKKVGKKPVFMGLNSHFPKNGQLYPYPFLSKPNTGKKIGGELTNSEMIGQTYHICPKHF